MIRVRLLNKQECAQADYDGVPPTIEVTYCGEVRRAVLEQRVETDVLYEWAIVEVEP